MVKEAIKAHIIDSCGYPQMFKSDTHTIIHQLNDKQACGEPIMINNFVIDAISTDNCMNASTIIIKIYTE